MLLRAQRPVGTVGVRHRCVDVHTNQRALAYSQPVFSSIVPARASRARFRAKSDCFHAAQGASCPKTRRSPLGRSRKMWMEETSATLFSATFHATKLPRFFPRWNLCA